jgi:hypothetical protein
MQTILKVIPEKRVVGVAAAIDQVTQTPYPPIRKDGKYPSMKFNFL